MTTHNKILYVIVGPTAVGKTAFAIQLATQLKTEIISADSRQIYKEMTIGTAKPSANELASVRHHFINTHSVSDHYSAGRYGEDAITRIEELFCKYDALVMVGGSGLYIKAVLEGFDDIPEIPSEIRIKLEEQYKQYGLEWLQKKLQSSDPETYRSIDSKNPHRLMRALEVKIHTDYSILHFRKKQKKQFSFSVNKIGLDLDREELYKRIDQRMDAMVQQGLFEEAKALYPQKHYNALQTVGYQEIFGYMDELYDKEEAIRLLKRNTRHYAKRQLTWFKRDTEIKWLNAETEKTKFLNNLNQFTF